MQYYHGCRDAEFHNTAVALGKFDGLHKGHMELINELVRSEDEGYQGVVYTFDEGISRVMKDKDGFIYTGIERAHLLADSGVDVLYESQFDREQSGLSPEDFIRHVLVERFGAKKIIVGDDFRFGHRRAGDVNTLRKYQERFDYQVTVVSKCSTEQGKISSSGIRRLLDQGKMEDAAALLSRFYSISGTVIYGNRLGRTLGIPTANVAVPDYKRIPPKGVYVSRISILPGNYRTEPLEAGDMADIEPSDTSDLKSWYGITDVGSKPTVGGTSVLAESNLFDFSGDLYGRKISAELLHYVRPEKKFPGVDALSEQMHRDIAFARKEVERLYNQ